MTEKQKLYYEFYFHENFDYNRSDDTLMIATNCMATAKRIQKWMIRAAIYQQKVNKIKHWLKLQYHYAIRPFGTIFGMIFVIRFFFIVRSEYGQSWALNKAYMNKAAKLYLVSRMTVLLNPYQQADFEALFQQHYANYSKSR